MIGALRLLWCMVTHDTETLVGVGGTAHYCATCDRTWQ